MPLPLPGACLVRASSARWSLHQAEARSVAFTSAFVCLAGHSRVTVHTVLSDSIQDSVEYSELSLFSLSPFDCEAGHEPNARLRPLRLASTLLAGPTAPCGARKGAPHHTIVSKRRPCIGRLFTQPHNLRQGAACTPRSNRRATQDGQRRCQRGPSHRRLRRKCWRPSAWRRSKHLRGERRRLTHAFPKRLRIDHVGEQRGSLDKRTDARVGRSRHARATHLRRARGYAASPSPPRSSRLGRARRRRAEPRALAPRPTPSPCARPGRPCGARTPPPRSAGRRRWSKEAIPC